VRNRTRSTTSNVIRAGTPIAPQALVIPELDGSTDRTPQARRHPSHHITGGGPGRSWRNAPAEHQALTCRARSTPRFGPDDIDPVADVQLGESRRVLHFGRVLPAIRPRLKVIDGMFIVIVPVFASIASTVAVSVLISALTVLVWAMAVRAVDTRTAAAMIPTTNRFLCPPSRALKHVPANLAGSSGTPATSLLPRICQPPKRPCRSESTHYTLITSAPPARLGRPRAVPQKAEKREYLESPFSLRQIEPENAAA
jgi:hypothetical protein